MKKYYICFKKMDDMAIIYFEAKGEQLLERIGMTKSEFARRMGIRRQNVKSLFKSKNLETIFRASHVLGIPFEMLVGYTSEPEEFPPFMPDEETPDGSGLFGIVYNSFRGCPKEAFWYLIDHQEGDLAGVFFREEIGDIDLVWGDDNCGVKHILLKHINNKDFPTINQMIETVTDVVSEGNLYYDNPDKAVFERNGYLAVIRKNYRINGKKPETKNWTLTAYSKKSSDTTNAPPGAI